MKNILFSVLLIWCNAMTAEPLQAQNRARIFCATGIVEEIQFAEATIIIKHDAISNYMSAMTMPFKVESQNELAGLKRGDKITFQLHITEDRSWVDGITKIGSVRLPIESTPPKTITPSVQTKRALLDYQFTNELGQAVSLNDFRGQALALTFFYTRCPLPEFCPRLSKNFAQASAKLEAMTNAPSNWHFISVSFDPQFDTPQTLKNYGESYHYDPARWSFLTGPPEKIGELARACGVDYTPDGGAIHHNFRTLIVNAAGHLQMVFPTSGDLSDQIVAQILKAAAATNGFIANNQR